MFMHHKVLQNSTQNLLFQSPAYITITIISSRVKNFLHPRGPRIPVMSMKNPYMQ